MIRTNYSSQTTESLIDLYEARIDALNRNIDKLKLIIKTQEEWNEKN